MHQSRCAYTATTAAAATTVWLTVVVHEVAHGLVCVRFDGRVPEIGVMWRFPLFAPYCKVDDSVLFPRRRQRVLTAFAGVFANLAVLLPFAALWLMSSSGPAVEGYLAAVLLVGAVTSLVNLVPFLQLDGYFMLSHALGYADLRRETYEFWRRRLQRSARVAGGATADYRRVDRGVYTAYGLAIGAFLLTVVGAIVSVWFVTLRAVLGPWAAGGMLCLQVLVVAALAAWLVARRTESGSAEA